MTIFSVAAFWPRVLLPLPMQKRPGLLSCPGRTFEQMEPLTSVFEGQWPQPPRGARFERSKRTRRPRSAVVPKCGQAYGFERKQYLASPRRCCVSQCAINMKRHKSKNAEERYQGCPDYVT